MIRRIEEAALNSWPALQQVLHDGWLVRFADGYTKRANSVNPLYESVGDTTRNVEFCEALYAERAMPAIFRLTPLAPPDLDGILAARGYARIDSTLVLQRSPGGEAFPAGAGELRVEPLGDWLDHFHRLSGCRPAGSETHRRMLEQIIGRRFLATLRRDGLVAGCALAVLDADLLGLFDLIVDAAFRRRGVAATLMAGLLRWGQGHGAELAYLQVMERNEPALRLYVEKLGFEPAYGYWYRVPIEP